MKESHYFKLRQEIEAKCRNDLAALDRVWVISNKTDPPKVEHNESKRGSVSKVVKAIVSNLHGTFTISDVIVATIKADSTLSNKVPAIRTAFKRLDIEVASPKSGAKQALYRLKKQPVNTLEEELGVR